MRSPDLIVAGHLSLDGIEAEGVLAGEVPGGGALYAALAARACGAVTGLVAAVAPDFPASQLDQYGLDLRGVFPVAGYQRRTHMQYTRSGDRVTPAHARAEWWVRTMDQLPPAVLPAAYVGARVLHIAPTQTVRQRQLAEHARDQGLLVTLDTSEYFAARDPAGVMQAARAADVFLPSAAECASLFGEGTPIQWARWLLEGGVPVVVIKQGVEGAILAWGGGRQVRHVPVCPVTAIDPTGAGDSFDGGFAAALALGADWEEAVSWAAAVAATSVTAVGPAALLNVDVATLLARSLHVKARIQQI